MKNLSTEMGSIITNSNSVKEASEKCAIIAKEQMVKLLNDITRTSEKDGNRMHVRISKLRMAIERDEI